MKKIICLLLIIFTFNSFACDGWNCDIHDKNYEKQKLVYCHNNSDNIENKIYWIEESLKELNKNKIKNSQTKEFKKFISQKYNHLGALYEDQRNYVKAFHNYEISAKQGEPFAQYNLARLYSLGKGTIVDLEKAYAWFKTSLYQGTAKSTESIVIDSINSLESGILNDYRYVECKENCLPRAKTLAKKYIEQYVIH